jgi:hypothetical protein
MAQTRKIAMLSAQEKMLSPTEMQERFVPLDPNLGNLKEADTNLNRQTNWTLIARELKKFGIIVDIITKEKLIKGNQEIINNLLPLIVKYEMRRGLVTELIMLDNIIENINSNENLLSEGTDSRVRTPNILAMSRS